MWAVIRVRGTINISPHTKKTLELLMLNRPHHMVLVDESSNQKNMVLKAKDYLTFGEIDQKSLELLLSKRGRLEGNKRISKEKLKEFKASDFSDLAGQIIKNGKKLRELGIKRVFRLNSPKTGFERKGVKKSFNVGGALGYRGQEINLLLEKMM